MNFWLWYFYEYLIIISSLLIEWLINFCLYMFTESITITFVHGKLFLFLAQINLTIFPYHERLFVSFTNSHNIRLFSNILYTGSLNIFSSIQNYFFQEHSMDTYFFLYMIFLTFQFFALQKCSLCSHSSFAYYNGTVGNTGLFTGGWRYIFFSSKSCSHVKRFWGRPVM